MFENLKKDEDIDAPKDNLGGGGLLGSGLYDAKIDVAYMEQSAKGATGIVLHFKLNEGRFYRQTIWITNRKGEHIWANQAGQKGYMPGFVLFDEMCVLLTGKDAAQLPEPEKKTINVYDYTSRKEKPTEKPVLTTFTGGEIKLGILQMKEDHYKDTKTWAEKNDIAKVFDAKGLTASEKIAGVTDGEFADKWLNKFQFEMVDKRKESLAGQKYVYKAAPQGNSDAKTEGDAAAAPSLFSDKKDA